MTIGVANERQTAAMIIAAITGLQYRDIGGVSMAAEEAVLLLEDVLIHGIRRSDERGSASFEEALSNVYEDLALLDRPQDEQAGLEL